MNRVLLILNLVLLVALAVYVFLRPSGARTVYVINSELFTGFKGKQALEGKLKQIKAENAKALDSLVAIAQRSNRLEAMQQVRASEENFRMMEQQLSDQYTQDIWKGINAHLLEFGKDKGYAYVLGASGNGNVMYADDAFNVTQEAIEYINKKYEGED